MDTYLFLSPVDLFRRGLSNPVPLLDRFFGLGHFLDYWLREGFLLLGEGDGPLDLLGGLIVLGYEHLQLLVLDC